MQWTSLNHHIDSLSPPKKQSRRGLLIVVEGIDGSGKTSQSRRLISKLEHLLGYVPMSFDFPDYEGNINGGIIARYLKGEFGDMNEIDPKVAALWYAGDRLETRGAIVRALEGGNVVVLNRYVPSNEVYGRAKYASQEEKEQFSSWLIALEYETNLLPRPDLVLVMDIEEEMAERFLDNKGDRQYLADSGKKLDQHETNREYQSQVRQEYLAICGQRSNWERVVVGDKEATHRHVMEKVMPLLSRVQTSKQ